MDPAVRLERLGRRLEQWRILWEPVPFKCDRLPWETEDPAWARAIRALDDDALATLERNDEARLHWASGHRPELSELGELAGFEALTGNDRGADPRLSQGVRQRKWVQIDRFARCLPPHGLPLLDWCSGKGHLGRVLGRVSGQPVTCVERDSRLAHEGRLLAADSDVRIDFETVDALSEDAARLIRPVQHAVALHACGELHLRLLDRAREVGTRALSLSPCCYHLIEGPRYRPRSRVGSRVDLQLDRDLLRVPLQETVTASETTRRKRIRANRWRLGFDLLQREIRGDDRYLPVPPFPDAWLKGSFRAFCRSVADLKRLELPPTVDFDRYRRAGAERFRAVRRLVLIRHLFRRPLEAWLVLDRAQALAESGYAVEVGTFCEREVTPRNLLILARLP